MDKVPEDSDVAGRGIVSVVRAGEVFRGILERAGDELLSSRENYITMNFEIHILLLG